MAELALGSVILVIVAAVLINHLRINHTSTATQQDRVFAFTKAQTILAEIQSYVDSGQAQAAIDLDAFDDGVVNKPTLTIATSGGTLVAPGHPLSANLLRGDGQWSWSRRITVQPFAGLNNRNVRYVTVRIYKKDKDGTDRSMADLSSVVNSVGSAFPTTQVFDIYLLACENIPGWWVYMEAIVPFVESAITDLEARNPGLKLRTHWIYKASYGRNELYRPYINDAVDSQAAVPFTYYYPGKMPTGSGSEYYYVPDIIKARMSFDGVERGGFDAVLNPKPYALADYYNHAMRYPRELALWKDRTKEAQQRKQDIAAAVAAGTTPPPALYDMDEEPTLRLFLEDLCTNPSKYKNALIINLHGELLPMPAMRNYSDPAKAPDLLPNVRVVTHPEELRTRRDSTIVDDVRLRVYAYTTDPPSYAGPQTMPTANPIAIQIMGVDLTDSAQPNNLMLGAGVSCLPGGVTISGGNADYGPMSAAKHSGMSYASNEMFFKAQFVDPGVGQEKYTVIYLNHTPVVAPYTLGLDGSWRGLENTERSRLYGLEYVPACTETALDFSRNLYAAGSGPKNTARWNIRVPGTVFAQNRFVDLAGTRYNPNADVVLTVRTRIIDSTLADPMLSGTIWPTPIAPDNFSETYTWWADNATDVPLTERSQFLGDPRHNPYSDLWNATGRDFQNGYNWYHDALNNGGEDSLADYPGITGSLLRNRWQSSVRADVPRMLDVLRTGLVNSSAVYTTLTGFSYYYLGIGNEIGYDSANNYPNSIPCNSGPFGFTTAGWQYVNNITNSRSYVMNGVVPYWWGMTWLGELYEDRNYAAQWIALDGGGKVRGNLNAGAVTQDHYTQWQDNWVYTNSNKTAFGTSLVTSMQRLDTLGCMSFFNIDTGNKRFCHVFSGGNGNLVGAGLDIGNTYNYPLPSSAPINRPWTLVATNGPPNGFSSPPYSMMRNTARILETYFDHHTGNTGSGLVELKDWADTSAAYIVVNGISQTVASGSSFIAKYSLLTMIHSFLEAGDSTLNFRIKMPPRVEITSPTDITELLAPTSIPIVTTVDWVRWDGQKYTSGTSSTFSENESELEYVVMYSKDNGTTWNFLQDDSAAIPGTKPTSSLYLIPDSGTGPDTFTWTTPATTFPEGSYLVRVECYRTGQQLHYSQHQAKVFIDR